MRTPMPVPGRSDLRGAPLSPTDGFVFSLVDGRLDEHEIATSTGLPRELVSQSLAKLEALGFIEFEASNGAARQRDATPEPSPDPPPAQRAEAAAARGRAAPSTPTLLAQLAPLTPEDDALLAEDADLDDDLKRLVLQTHRALDRIDHYGLLNVGRDADRKAVKRAYYDLAAKFHPDRYFRKKLGSFKSRMEAVFGRLTLAHDTLTDRERRAEYDAYLEEQRRSRGIEELLADALTEAKRAEEQVEQQMRERAPEPAQSSTPPTVSPERTSQPQQSTAIPDAARRDALARRLLGGRPRPAPGPSATPPQSPARGPGPANATPSPAEAMEALRRRYQERVTKAKESQARKYIKNGQDALAGGDPVAAVNAFKVALTLSPDDPELQRSARTAQTRADAILAETYARQAGYEEKNSQWMEAARSWGRVAKARPADPSALERAANALLRANGDLHEAARLAGEACKLQPESAPYRTTLAAVYLAAGLAKNARRELETAAQLAPHDGTIQAMLKRVGKV
jgi:curved DNA-binding protein CbpA